MSYRMDKLLTKVLHTGPNLVILAWTGFEIVIDTQTDIQTQAMTILVGQNASGKKWTNIQEAGG